MPQPDAERDQLELLASEFLDRLRRGEAPSVEEYAEAYPDMADDIRDLFPTIAAAEKLLTQKLEHDRNPDSSDTAEERNTDRSSTVTQPAPPHAGRTLGKYTLIECIGEGGLGTVWRSVHPEFDIPVAVKVLRPDVIAGDMQVQRFLREARTAAQLNHPHIVRVYDAGFDKGLHYLVMELVEGGSVGRLLTRAHGPLGVDIAVNIAAAVADALTVANQRSIVHRDIKPDNILLDTDGTPKLADLGLAKRLTAEAPSHVTAPGTGLGTPLYVAPEQAHGNTAGDARSDIYSLGATLFHMVTGQPPFDGATAFQIVHRHVSDPAPDPRSLNPAVSPRLAEIILKMLAKEPADRFQSAAQLHSALSQIDTRQTAQPTDEVQVRTGRAWRWAAWAAAATAVVLLLAWTARSILTREARRHPAAETADRQHTDAASRDAQPHDALRTPAGPDAESPGTVLPQHWQMQIGDMTRDQRPKPLTQHQIEHERGVLSIFPPENPSGPVRLVYGMNPIQGPFSAHMQVRGVTELGIIDPIAGDTGINITLTAPDAAENWQQISLRGRPGGTVVCRVNGRLLAGVKGTLPFHGRFWLGLTPGTPCELRAFHLEFDAPAAQQPLPRQRPPEQFPSPRRLPPRP
jgi:serine/threonine protein kinase